MDRDAIETMARVEDRHWWFVARRRVVDHVIAGIGLAPDAAILDAGCGTGGNLAMLGRHGSVSAFEPDDAARRHARRRGLCAVEKGALPDAIPFADTAFDLITFLDVIEHVADDHAALRGLHDRLKPGASLVLTGPAYRFLWGPHDDANRHYRRYTRAGLARRVGAAGFEIAFITYYNFWLFPAAAASRLMAAARGRAGDELAIPAAPLNRLLEAVMASERHLVGRVPLPFGLSLLLRARRCP